MLMGTDNKLKVESVLKRWQHIIQGCKDDVIEVGSIGADGDTRVLKTMRLSSNLFLIPKLIYSVQSLKFPQNGSHVFYFAYCSICPGHSAHGSQTEVKIIKAIHVTSNRQIVGWYSAFTNDTNVNW